MINLVLICAQPDQSCVERAVREKSEGAKVIFMIAFERGRLRFLNLKKPFSLLKFMNENNYFARFCNICIEPLRGFLDNLAPASFETHLVRRIIEPIAFLFK